MLAPESGAAAKPNWTQKSELNGPSGSAFGFATAISGSTMLVEEPYANGGDGAVEIYAKSGSSWVKQTELTAPSGGNDHGFGAALAILNPSTIVVTAPYHANFAGEVWVYTGSGSSWSVNASFSDPNATSFDYFGDSVAVSGNRFVVNGDETGTGAVYTYAPSGGTYALQNTLTPADGGNDYFGWSLAASGSSLVVGSPYHDGGDGAVYVYLKSGSSNWALQSELQDPGANPSDQFGFSVGMDGTTLVSGAPDNGAGTAYVFTQSGSSWAQTAQLSPSDGTSGDQFAYNVAISKTTIAIGSSGHNGGAGAAYVFTPGAGSSWVQTELTTPADVTAGAYFGWPTVTFDGTQVVISAPYTSTGGLYWFGN